MEIFSILSLTMVNSFDIFQGSLKCITTKNDLLAAYKYLNASTWKV